MTQLQNADTTKVDEKEAEKQRAAAEKEAEKQRKAAEREAERERKKAEKEAEKAKKADEREAARKAKEEEKARKADERKANRMPEQNGVRRPKPDTLCGRVWTEADNLSFKLGQPVPIKMLLEECLKHGMNENNIKAEYARWRKFNGVTGRVSLPTPEKAEEKVAKAKDSK